MLWCPVVKLMPYCVFILATTVGETMNKMGSKTTNVNKIFVMGRITAVFLKIILSGV